MPGGISCMGSGWNVDATDEWKRKRGEVWGDHNSRCRIWQMDLSSSAVIRYHYVVMVQKLISYRKRFDWELRTDPISEIIKDLSFLRILKIALSMREIFVSMEYPTLCVLFYSRILICSSVASLEFSFKDIPNFLNKENSLIYLVQFKDDNEKK